MKEEFQPKQFLGYLLAHSMKGTIARLLQLFKEAGYDIGRAQWVVLAKSYQLKDEPLLQSDVVELLMGDKTGVTRAVDDLVKKGWLCQEIDPLDRRNRVLALTKQGEEVVPKLMGIAQQCIEEVTRGIAKEDVEVCKSVLSKIIENIASSNH